VFGPSQWPGHFLDGGDDEEEEYAKAPALTLPSAVEVAIEAMKGQERKEPFLLLARSFGSGVAMDITARDAWGERKPERIVLWASPPTG